MSRRSNGTSVSVSNPIISRVPPAIRSGGVTSTRFSSLMP